MTSCFNTLKYAASPASAPAWLADAPVSDHPRSELPAHYRAVMVLHDVEGLSMAEVADVLGITVQYVRPSSVPDALVALARYRDDAKVLAGGQSLIALMNLRLVKPAVLVDINRLSDIAGLDP
jgi:FAD binding domain in molybdopterin dehydrogenase/Sigma-70, region 4